MFTYKNLNTGSQARSLLPHPSLPTFERQFKYIKKGQPGYDPLFKLRPFVDPLVINFQKAYHPGREISVDESMIGFKGRLYFV